MAGGDDAQELLAGDELLDRRLAPENLERELAGDGREEPLERVRQAPDPGWHYVIVGLKRDSPELRSYSIGADGVVEEPIELI